MYTLVGYEVERKGGFKIPTGNFGCVKLYSDTDMLVVFGQSKTPEKDFNFDIPVLKEGKEVAKIHFDYALIKEALFATLELQNGEFSIKIKIGLSLPLTKEIEGPHIKVELPKHFAIGHRGSGSNLVAKEFLENTMPGFNKALERGADVIEFDVQLANDSTPVIFHDFFIERDEKFPGIEPVKVENNKYCYSWIQLSVEQHRDSGLDTEWKCLRPTYKQLMTELPKNAVFDIEIKYPFSQLFEGKVPYEERNKFLQRVFDEMEKYMGDRSVFFSTFDPILCTMLATKQHKWDVYQLMTVEKNEVLDTLYLKAKAFAPLHKELGIKGYVIDSDHLLKIPHLVKELKDMGFSVSTYGKPNNTPEGIVQQLDLGVSGICADTMVQLRKVIDEYDEKHN